MSNKYTLLILFSLVSSILSSQIDNDTIGLPSDILEVSKAKALTLQSFEFIDIPVSEEQPEVTQIPIDFQIQALDYEFPKVQAKIKPLRHQYHREPNYNDGWLQVGFGAPNQILGDVGYYYSIENWYGLGADVRYHSTKDKARYQANFTDINSNVQGHYFINKQLKALAGVHYNYGQVGLRDESFETLDTFPQPLLDQSHNNVGAYIGLHGTPYQSLKLLYGLQGSYDLNFIRQHQFNENHFHASGYLKKSFKDVFGFNVDADIARTIATLNQQKSSATALNIKPYLNWKNDLFNVIAGLNMMTAELNQFYPYAELAYTFDDKNASLSLGANSYNKVANFHEIKSIIPEVLPSLDWIQSNIEKQLFFKGAFNKNKTKQHIKLSYRSLENEVNFFYDARASRLVGQSIDYTLLSANLAHSMQVNDWLTYQLDLTQNLFLTGASEQLALLPTTFFKGTLEQSLFEHKLSLSQSIFYIKRNEIIKPEETLIIDDIIDLNVEINYAFNDQLSGFAKGYNLLNTSYLQWENYYSYGIQFLAGIKYVF